MVTLSFIFYAIGCGLLIAAYFVNTTLAWWLAGGALVALIIGGVCQYKAKAKSIEEDNKDNL